MNNQNNKMRLLPVIAIVVAMACSIALAAKNSRWDDNARCRKADYLYLESQNQEMQDNNDASYELLREAFRLNPDDKSIGFDYGASMLPLSFDDSVSFINALALMDDYFINNPTDLDAGRMYAAINEYIGMTPKAVEVWGLLHAHHPDNTQVTVNLITALQTMRDTASLLRALDLYDIVYVAEGEPTSLLFEKMKLLYALGDTASMLKETRALLAKEGGRSKANVMLAGEVYDVLDRKDEALAYFQEAYRADSTDGSVSYRLANFYLNQGDSAAYDMEITRALTSPSLDPEVKAQLLRDYMGTHIDDSASTPRVDSLALSIIEMHPHDSDLRNIYAAFLSYNDRIRESCEQLRYSLDIEPDQRSQWIVLASELSSMGDTRGVIDVYTDALRYFPDDYLFYYLRGSEHMVLSEDDSAIADFDSSLKADSTNVEIVSRIYGAKGDMYHRQGRLDECFAAYDKSLSLTPDEPFVLNNYAYALAQKGERLDDALAMAEKAVALEEDSMNSADTYAWVLFKRKEYQKAREVFDRKLKDFLNETDEEVPAELYEHGGDIYFMTGDVDEAVEYWQRALMLDPANERLMKKIEHRAYFFE